MPSRMIHYLIAEQVAEQMKIKDINRFKIGSLCPDMSLHTDGSKNQTHYFEIHGDKKGGNWLRFAEEYGDRMQQDELYLGILCHLITDMIWFHEIMETQIRSKVKSKEERQKKYQAGYTDFHKLNYLLREEFDLRYELTEDRNIDLAGIHPELYDEVFDGLFKDFFLEPRAEKKELTTYTYDITIKCIELCVLECVSAINSFRTGKDLLNPETYFVPVRARKEYPMRIIFVRHGHPNYVNDCLTELGHKHAAAVAERLKDEGISEIYSSTCGRAYETAGYVAEKYGLPIVKCDFMREISWGSVDNEPIAFDGHPWSTVDDMVAKGESMLNPNWAKEEPFVRNKLVGYVENIAVALDEWLETLGYKREGLYYRVLETAKDGTPRNTVKSIAAFGHGGAGSAIFSHLFNLPYPFVCTTMNQDYTGITIVELPDTPGALIKPRFEIMNDARHIHDLKIENIYDK